MPGSPTRDLRVSIDIDTIPTLPAIAFEAMRLMEGEQSSLQTVAGLLKNDQVLTSRILHYANSAFVGSRRAATIEQALAVLGFNATRSIILSSSIFDCFTRRLDENEKKGLVDFWLHSVGVAAMAETLARELSFPDPNAAYIAGLLHDLGKLVCYLQFPQKFGAICQELDRHGTYSEQGTLPLDIEHALLGTDHLEVGKLLAKRWHFPESLAQVMWLHHQPVVETIRPDESQLPQLIRFADVLCVTHGIGSSYFLTEGPSCHEHYHFALENLVRHHHLDGARLEAILEGVRKKVETVATLLGFWDGDAYRKIARTATAGLGSIARTLETSNRELADDNRMLAAITEMMSRLNAGCPIEEAAGVIAQCAVKAFGVSHCLCIVRDTETDSFLGRILKDGESHEVVIPTRPGALVCLPNQESGSEIEIEAIRQLASSSAELKQGPAPLESWLGKAASGTPYLAALFLADPKSRSPKDPILGELVLDISENGDAGSRPNPKFARRGLESFAVSAASALERFHLERHLERQSAHLAELSRKMEENQRQLFHSHRLASVGQMAAGAAHEINNPLTIISLNIQVLERLISKATDNRDILERLKVISGQERRIAKIVQDIMGFARPAQPKFSPASVPAIVSRVAKVIGDRICMKSITLELDLPEDLPTVMVDPHQMEQVFMNLLVNACQAMPRGGTIAVTGRGRKEFVDILVRDTGGGINETNLNRIFDPFFTTKREGEGTGLGLAICNSLVEHNGGRLRVESELGKGSTFTVSLPMDKGSRLRAMKEAIEKKVAAKALRPISHSILVIDDEQILNNLLQESLRLAGYEVEGAYDGVEGIGLLRYKKYDLILLDIRMPRKDGFEVLEFLREEYPQLKVIIITGLSSEAEVQETLKKGVFACIRKPFRLEEVLDAVKEALEPEGKTAADFPLETAVPPRRHSAGAARKTSAPPHH